MKATNKDTDDSHDAEASRKRNADGLDDLPEDIDMSDDGDDTIEVIEALSVDDDTVLDIQSSTEIEQTLSAVEPHRTAPAPLHVRPQTRSAMADMSFHDFEAFMTRSEGGPDLRTARPSAIAGAASTVGNSAEFELTGSSKSAESVGKPTRTRPISKIRDAKFLRFIRDLADIIDQGGDTADLYRKYRFSNNKKSRAPGALGSSKALPDSASGDDAIPAEDSDAAPGSGPPLTPRLKTSPGLIIPTSVRVLCASPGNRYIRAASRYRPWWHEKELPETAARSHRTPADWDYTSNQLRVKLRHIAIKAIAERLATSAFSIRLRLAPEIEARTKSRDDQIDWLRERLTKHMKAEMGEAPPFHIVLTRGRQNSLILRGEMALPHAQKKAARQALEKVGGWFAGVDKDALRMDSGPDNGWVNILVRDLRVTGSPISANRQVEREARRIYEHEWLPLIDRFK